MKRPNPVKGLSKRRNNRDLDEIIKSLTLTKPGVELSQELTTDEPLRRANRMASFLPPMTIRTTPSGRWREQDGVDPFPELINQERGALALGDLTDDEMAYAVFMYGNMPADQNLEAMIKGDPCSIVYLKGAQDRIRWLSRHLEMSLVNEQTLIARVKELEEENALLVDCRRG